MSALRAQAHLINRDASNWAKDFPVTGQGVVIFNLQRDTDFFVVVRPKCECLGQPGMDEWITLAIKSNSAEFSMRHNGELKSLKTIIGTVNEEMVGFEPGRKISYWFSYNRDLLTLKYGKGYIMEETTLMTYSFLDDIPPNKQEDVRERHKNLFSPYIRRRIEQYDEIPSDKMLTKYANIIKHNGLEGAPALKQWPALKDLGDAELEAKCKVLAKSLIDIEGKVAFDKTPFVCNWSPFVLDSSSLDLFNLDSNKNTFSASLPPACLELYSNVTAQNIELDWPYTDKYKLSDAIQHSLTDESGILYKKLQSKASEFGHDDIKKTYLRVTLGQDRGSSPGIPYVLEIWPAHHGSPIHNHGNSYAVIKVIYGGLTIQVFNKHTDTDTKETKHLMEFNVSKGDCTWISPNWFQTHKLWNHNKVFCATIQCYQYGTNDYTHWPYFDYVADTKVIDEFLPNSDYTFHEMRDLVMKEYLNHTKSKL